MGYWGEISGSWGASNSSKRTSGSTDTHHAWNNGVDENIRATATCSAAKHTATTACKFYEVVRICVSQSEALAACKKTPAGVSMGCDAFHETILCGPMPGKISIHRGSVRTNQGELATHEYKAPHEHFGLEQRVSALNVNHNHMASLAYINHHQYHSPPQGESLPGSPATPTPQPPHTFHTAQLPTYSFCSLRRMWKFGFVALVLPMPCSFRVWSATMPARCLSSSQKKASGMPAAYTTSARAAAGFMRCCTPPACISNTSSHGDTPFNTERGRRCSTHSRRTPRCSEWRGRRPGCTRRPYCESSRTRPGRSSPV